MVGGWVGSTSEQFQDGVLKLMPTRWRSGNHIKWQQKKNEGKYPSFLDVVAALKWPNNVPAN